MNIFDFNDRKDEYLQAIEELNAEYIAVLESKEYREGQKILNWKKIIRHRQIIKKIKDYFKHIKATAVENNAIDNFSEDIWRSYLHYGNKDIKVVVYSCITGGYDCVKEPLLNLPNIHYVMYTDRRDYRKSETKWEYKMIPSDLTLDNNNINRYIKMHPFELFQSTYDYSIYIDGNVQPISDLSVFSEMIDKRWGIAIHKHRYRNCIYDEALVCEWKGKGNTANMRNQIGRYKKEGFPVHYGLGECTVIATDLHNEIAEKIFDMWWNEYLISSSKRDQLSLPYVLWKLGISTSEICTLGSNLYRNKKIRVYGH